MRDFRTSLQCVLKVISLRCDVLLKSGMHPCCLTRLQLRDWNANAGTLTWTLTGRRDAERRKQRAV